MILFVNALERGMMRGVFEKMNGAEGGTRTPMS